MRILLVLVVLSACGTASKESKIERKKGKKLIIAGHAYGTPNQPPEGAFFKPLEQFLDNNISNYSYGVFTGDLVISPDSLNWAKVANKLKGYNKKFFWAAGNHDLGPGLHCHKAFDNFWEVIIDDSCLLGSFSTIHEKWTISANQLEILDSAFSLNKNELNKAFIFVHNVMWFDSTMMEAHPNSFAQYPGNRAFWEKLAPKFISWGIPVYIIAGDVGAVWDRPACSYYNHKNLHLITSGMGASPKSNVLEVNLNGGIEDMFFIFLNNNEVKRVKTFKKEIKDLPRAS
jgi:hypothetical protein